MSTHEPRPWYVIESACDGYAAIDVGELRMLQALKVIRGITLNAVVAVMSLFAIVEGGDPTIVASLGLVALMLVNGIEATDYVAAKQALEEAKREAADDE